MSIATKKQIENQLRRSDISTAAKCQNKMATITSTYRDNNAAPLELIPDCHDFSIDMPHLRCFETAITTACVWLERIRIAEREIKAAEQRHVNSNKKQKEKQLRSSDMSIEKHQ